jgi:hypothetical protein
MLFKFYISKPYTYGNENVTTWLITKKIISVCISICLNSNLDKEDIENMVRKLMEEYEKWRNGVNTQKSEYLYIGAESKNLVMEGNEKVRTCKEYKYLRIKLNREGADVQEINNNIIKTIIKIKEG